MGAVAHVGENLLGRLRDGQLALDREITTALLAMVDAVRQMLASIESAGVEGDRDDSALIANLTRLQRGSEAPAKTEAPAPLKAAAAAAGVEMDERTAAIGKAPTPQVEAAKPVVPAPPRETAATTTQSDTGEAQRAQQPGRGQSSGVSVSDGTIRLDVGLLDQLMNLVGELVLARNQVLQFANSTEDGGLLATSQRLNLITSELQEGVMKTRMQPIGNIWSKLPRTVRDLALACGKRVRVEMEGKETELDKTLIEAIKDPLTHIVRNSVDHGIESPEIREAAGKNPEGCLSLRAFHEGGQVNIEIADDGAGLDQDRIRSKAVQKGLITTDQVARLSDREIVNLVFLPGFSTAEKVTNVSGRGVGTVSYTHLACVSAESESRVAAGHGRHHRPGHGKRSGTPLSLIHI